MRDSMGTSAFVFQGGDRLSESNGNLVPRPIQTDIPPNIPTTHLI